MIIIVSRVCSRSLSGPAGPVLILGDKPMSTATQPKPVPAVLVYGTPTSPELTQASWFRAEDKEAAKAAAETSKFFVIDIETEAEKALTLGIHEGVLKGSGRMIVGSVS